jgi:hypothetical protein
MRGADSASHRLRLLLLHKAVKALAAPPPDRLAELPGSVVCDELALDFEQAWGLLASLETVDGTAVSPQARVLLSRIEVLLSVPPDDPMWRDATLATHPQWQEIRAAAQTVQPLLPLVD